MISDKRKKVLLLGAVALSLLAITMVSSSARIPEYPYSSLLSGGDCNDQAYTANPGFGSEAGWCGDGLDNDCDGKTDCRDSDCAGASICETCGNGVCEPGMGENANSCYSDCGSCGDGVCSGPEDASSCEVDCGEVPCSEDSTQDKCTVTCQEDPTQAKCDGGNGGNGGNGGGGDNIPPSTSVNAPSGWQNEPVTITFNLRDSGGSGVASVQHCLGSGCFPPSGSSGNSMTISQEGVHTVRYRAKDQAGNVERTGSVQVKVDLTAPSVSVDASKTNGQPYTGGWSSQPVSLHVACSDSPSGCRGAGQGLRLVGGPGVCPGEGDRKAQSTFSDYNIGPGYTLGDDEQGVFYVCAASEDVAGNTGFGGASPDAMEVRVDSTGPQVSASTDSPTTDTREGVSYTVTESNLQSCTASGAGVSWSCSESDPDNDGTYQGTCSPGTGMSDGSHTVTVSCEDVAGNAGSDSVSLTVDTAAPSVQCDGCDSPDPVKSGAEVTFSPDASDATTGVASIQICESEGGSADCTDTYCTGTTSCSYETPDNSYGERGYYVRATDGVGNTETVGPFTFTFKKWVGDSCTTDQECLIGECSTDAETGQSTCQYTTIPEPGIVVR